MERYLYWTYQMQISWKEVKIMMQHIMLNITLPMMKLGKVCLLSPLLMLPTY